MVKTSTSQSLGIEARRQMANNFIYEVKRILLLCLADADYLPNQIIRVARSFRALEYSGALSKYGRSVAHLFTIRRIE